MINSQVVELLNSDTLKFGALFVFLLYYVLKTTKERESWLKKHIERADESLSEIVEVMKMMKVDLYNKMDRIDEKLGRLEEGQKDNN